MSDILIAMLSPAGHVSPLLGVAADLVARGNRVTVMTGGVHAAAVRAVGAELHPLPPIADLDDDVTATRHPSSHRRNSHSGSFEE